MNKKIRMLTLACCFLPFTATANDNTELLKEIEQLKQETHALQTQLNHIQKKLVNHTPKKHVATPTSKKESAKKKKGVKNKKSVPSVHHSVVTVNALDGDPASVEFNPAALMADGKVVTYIAGMPVVTSDYLGDRPAFDGSDYMVNISSINRDIRLMQQRRRLYEAYHKMGYPRPNLPILTLSGKAEPAGSWHQSTYGEPTGDWTLGSSELDAAAALNDKVEAYLALAYDESPPVSGGPRVANSALNLYMGFINIGDLDVSPYYFTAGQLYVPFGRFSTAMVSAPLTMRMGRTKSRPFIVGYKSQGETGPFAAGYAFKSDTTLGNSAIGGVNLGYVFGGPTLSGEVGASFISSMDDVGGLQVTGSPIGTTFGGFASPTNGSEQVHKVPGADVHAIFNVSNYSLTLEWVSSLGRFDKQDLSFNGRGAQLQGAQAELGNTFMLFDRPSSLGASYQWSKDTLALNMPHERLNFVFNISIWKDTVESIEYRHDIDFGRNQYANGAAPNGVFNVNTIGSGGTSDTLLLQIGVYF